MHWGFRDENLLYGRVLRARLLLQTIAFSFLLEMSGSAAVVQLIGLGNLGGGSPRVWNTSHQRRVRL